MPIYEYRCAACGHEFSRFERIGAEPKGAECPACHEARAERQLSTFASASSPSSGASSSTASASCGAGFS